MTTRPGKGVRRLAEDTASTLIALIQDQLDRISDTLHDTNPGLCRERARILMDLAYALDDIMELTQHIEEDQP